MRRHSWKEINRVPAKTERECRYCGMLRVTRHEGRHDWVEFWKPQLGEMPVQIHSDGTPPCEPVEAGVSG